MSYYPSPCPPFSNCFPTNYCPQVANRPYVLSYNYTETQFNNTGGAGNPYTPIVRNCCIITSFTNTGSYYLTLPTYGNTEGDYLYINNYSPTNCNLIVCNGADVTKILKQLNGSTLPASNGALFVWSSTLSVWLSFI
jgi:hypothetical protein